MKSLLDRSRKLASVGRAFVVEALAMMEAVDVALKFGYRAFASEGDVKNLVDQVNCKSVLHQEVEVLDSYIQTPCHALDLVMFQFFH